MAAGNKEQHKGAEEQTKKPLAVFIEFQNLTFNVRDLARIEQGVKSGNKFNSGVEYELTLRFFGPPWEYTFKYSTKALLDSTYALLKMRLEELRVVFETAVSFVIDNDIIEDDEQEQDEIEDEGLFDGLEDLIEE